MELSYFNVDVMWYQWAVGNIMVIVLATILHLTRRNKKYSFLPICLKKPSNRMPNKEICVAI